MKSGIQQSLLIILAAVLFYGCLRTEDLFSGELMTSFAIILLLLAIRSSETGLQKDEV